MRKSSRWGTRRLTVVLAVVSTILITANGAAASSIDFTSDTLGAADRVTALEVATALAALPDAALVPTGATSSGDIDSASVVESANGSTIDVARDAEAGVALTSPDAPSVSIAIPDAASAASPKTLPDGTLTFSGSDGTATAVRPMPNGAGVQMLNVISSTDSPTEFSYAVDVPAGGRVEVRDDGSGVVVDGAGNEILLVPAPWAKDAEGTSVPTRFESRRDGTALVQVVDHQSTDFSYPVVSDPIWFLVAPALFWAAVRRCGAGGLLSAAAAYLSGVRNGWALSAQGAVGCMSSFIGGTWILRNMIRTQRW